jgi:hypothetical protein
VVDIEQINEMFIYNNLTLEYKFLEIKKGDIYLNKNGQNTKTNWQNIKFSDGLELGKGPEEIYLISKNQANNNNHSKQRNEQTENYSSGCDL